MNYMPKVKQAKMKAMGNKSAPRPGAAKGQGGGLGGYNAAAVNKAVRMIAGSGGAPKYTVANTKVR